MPSCSDDAFFSDVAGTKEESTGNYISSTSISTSSPVDVLFWFNRDLDDIVQSRDAFKENFLKALEPTSHCFNRVEFKSARLSEEEDAYPFGPSNQWYDLFLSSDAPWRLTTTRSGASTTSCPCSPDGSMRCCAKPLSPASTFSSKGRSTAGASWTICPLPGRGELGRAHQRQRALQGQRPRVFGHDLAVPRGQPREHVFHVVVDTAMWIQHVTSYASRWEHYQNYAHKFQYTDLIQNLCRDVSWPDGARELVAAFSADFFGARFVGLGW